MKKKNKKNEVKEKKESKFLLKALPILFNVLVLTICILALKFDDVYTVNYLYLTPAILIVLSIYNLVYAIKNKELDLYKWLTYIVESIVFILMALLIVLNKTLSDKSFIIVFAFIYFIKVFTKFFVYGGKKLYFIIPTIICGLIIIFSSTIADKLYYTFILVLAVVSLIEGYMNVIKKD
jgi:hypothetical protein